MFLHLNNEYVVFGAVLSPMVNDDVGKDTIRPAALIASSYAIEELLDLSIAVIFAIDIPATKLRFQIHCQSMSCRAFVDNMEVERRLLIAEAMYCVRDYLLNLVVIHVGFIGYRTGLPVDW